MVTGALFAWSAWDQRIPQALGPSLRYVGTVLGLLLVVARVVWLLLRLLRRWLPVAPAFGASAVAALAFVLTAKAGAGPTGWYVVALALLLLSAVVGGSAWSLIRVRREPNARRRSRAPIVLAMASLILVGLLFWVIRPWISAVETEATQATEPAAAADADVETLTHGSGADRLRSSYGEQVGFRTRPVDASKLITGWGPGQAGDRTAMWGFDPSALPVNGRVWYPAGQPPDGRWPLVLIAHGNKSDVTFSDEGLGYLGEHLARRGYMVASIDQNFLNTSILNRVPLIGHSRGGGAVAQAAALEAQTAPGSNRAGRIQAVIGLAPTDPPARDEATERTRLWGIDYLLLQGALDVDVVLFEGQGQLERVELGPSNVKASVFLAHADHSQFNEDWGNRDVGFGMPKRFLDAGTLMSGADQRAIATGYVSAFLDRSLRGIDDLPGLFSRPPGAGTDPRAGWVPRTPLRTTYRTGGAAAANVLVDGQEETAKDTARLPGAKVAASGFTQCEEIAFPRRTGPGDDRALHLAWEDATKARYDVAVPNGTGLPAGGALLLDVAAPPGRQPTALTLEVQDRAGHRATSRIEPSEPIPGRSLIARWMQKFPDAEPALETVAIPVRDLLAQVPGFDAANLTQVSLLP